MSRNHADGPELAVLVMESTSVAATDSISCSLVCQRIMLRISIWTHRIVCNIDSVRIGKEFETDGSILEIVFAVVLCHPRSFDPWILLLIVRTATVEDREDHVIIPSVLESMVLVVSPEEDLRF